MILISQAIGMLLCRVLGAESTPGSKKCCESRDTYSQFYYLCSPAMKSAVFKGLRNKTAQAALFHFEAALRNGDFKLNSIAML
jgi:hypothetical protein